MTYEQVRAQLCEHFGWTFAVVDNMSLDQIYSAATMGKPKKGIPVASHDDVIRITRNWRRYLDF